MHEKSPKRNYKREAISQGIENAQKRFKSLENEERALRIRLAEIEQKKKENSKVNTDWKSQAQNIKNKMPDHVRQDIERRKREETQKGKPNITNLRNTILEALKLENSQIEPTNATLKIQGEQARRKMDSEKIGQLDQKIFDVSQKLGIKNIEGLVKEIADSNGLKFRSVNEPPEKESAIEPEKKTNKFFQKFMEGQKLAGESVANREGMQFGEKPPSQEDAPKPVKEPREPREKKDVLGELKKKAGNILPGFENLTGGQQDIVMKGLHNRLLTDIKQTAKNDFEEYKNNKKLFGKEWKDLGSFVNPFNDKEVRVSNPIAKVGGVWKSLWRNTITASFEKRAFIEMGGSETEKPKKEGWWNKLKSKIPTPYDSIWQKADESVTNEDIEARQLNFLSRKGGDIVKMIGKSGLDIETYGSEGEMIIDYTAGKGKEFSKNKLEHPAISSAFNNYQEAFDDYKSASDALDSIKESLKNTGQKVEESAEYKEARENYIETKNKYEKGVLMHNTLLRSHNSYNQAVEDLGKIPLEWRSPDAKEFQFKQYTEANKKLSEKKVNHESMMMVGEDGKLDSTFDEYKNSENFVENLTREFEKQKEDFERQIEEGKRNNLNQRELDEIARGFNDVKNQFNREKQDANERLRMSKELVIETYKIKPQELEYFKGLVQRKELYKSETPINPELTQLVGDYNRVTNEKKPDQMDMLNIIARYNMVSSELGDIPYEWQTPDATKAQREKYEEVSKKWRETKNEYITALAESKKLEKKQELLKNEEEINIVFRSAFENYNNSEKELAKISEKWSTEDSHHQTFKSLNDKNYKTYTDQYNRFSRGIKGGANTPESKDSSKKFVEARDRFFADRGVDQNNRKEVAKYWTEFLKSVPDNWVKAYSNEANYEIAYKDFLGKLPPEVLKAKEDRDEYTKIYSNFAEAKKAYEKKLNGHTEDGEPKSIQEKFEKLDTSKAEAATEVSQSIAKIKTMRFLFAHPEAAQRLENLGDQSAIRLGLGTDATKERAMFMGMGYAARGARMGMKYGGIFAGLTAVAAPVTAAIMGGWRGARRSQQALIEQNRIGRNFEYKESGNKLPSAMKGSTVFGMGNITRNIGKLEDYKTRYENIIDEKKKQQLISEMETRVDFMEAKLNLGQMNIGENVAQQAELMNLLFEIKVIVETERNSKEVVSRFEGVLDENENEATGLTEKYSNQGRLVGKEDVNLSHDVRSLLSLDYKEAQKSKNRHETETNSVKFGANGEYVAGKNLGREAMAFVYDIANVSYDLDFRRRERSEDVEEKNTPKFPEGALRKGIGERNQRKTKNARTWKITRDALKSAVIGTMFEQAGEEVAFYGPKFGWNGGLHAHLGPTANSHHAFITTEVGKGIDSLKNINTNIDTPTVESILKAEDTSVLENAKDIQQAEGISEKMAEADLKNSGLQDQDLEAIKNIGIMRALNDTSGNFVHSYKKYFDLLRKNGDKYHVYPKNNEVVGEYRKRLYTEMGEQKVAKNLKEENNTTNDTTKNTKENITQPKIKKVVINPIKHLEPTLEKVEIEKIPMEQLKIREVPTAPEIQPEKIDTPIPPEIKTPISNPVEPINNIEPAPINKISVEEVPMENIKIREVPAAPEIKIEDENIPVSEPTPIKLSGIESVNTRNYGEISSPDDLKEIIKDSETMMGSAKFKVEDYNGQDFTVVRAIGQTEASAQLSAEQQMNLARKGNTYDPRTRTFTFKKTLPNGNVEITEIRPHKIANPTIEETTAPNTMEKNRINKKIFSSLDRGIIKNRIRFDETVIGRKSGLSKREWNNFRESSPAEVLKKVAVDERYNDALRQIQGKANEYNFRARGNNEKISNYTNDLFKFEEEVHMAGRNEKENLLKNIFGAGYESKKTLSFEWEDIKKEKYEIFLNEKAEANELPLPRKYISLQKNLTDLMNKYDIKPEDVVSGIPKQSQTVDTFITTLFDIVAKKEYVK